MRAWMLACSAGIMLCSFMPELPGNMVLTSLLLLTALCHLHRLLRVPGAFVLGCIFMINWGQQTMNDLWPVNDQASDIRAIGIIWSLPEKRGRATRFIFKLEQQCELLTDFCEPLSRDSRKVLIADYSPHDLQPGQRWQLQLRLQRPHGSANPGGFDYEAWLLQQDISATGYVRDSSLNSLLPTTSWRPWFNRLRFALLQEIDNAGQFSLRNGPLLKALALGDKRDISDPQWEFFASFGINHLMVISGLHIGLIASLLYQLGLRLAVCSETLLLRLTSPGLAALMAIAGACLYCGLAGFTLPAIRALIMTTVVLTALLLRRQTTATHAFCLALLIVLLSNPLAAHGAGFWLSFTAVAILLSQLMPVPLQDENSTAARCSGIWQLVSLQLKLLVGMLPVMMIFFQQSSLLAPLVNLLAIPLIGLVVVPMVLSALLLLVLYQPLGALVLAVADRILSVFLSLLNALADNSPDFLQLNMPVLATPVLLLLIAACSAAVLGKTWLLRAGSGLLVIALLQWPQARPQTAAVDMTIFDVGQGMAILLQTRHYNLLYDSGPAVAGGFNAGTDLIIPYLQRQGIKQLSHIIISHGDNDHAGALPALATRFPQASIVGNHELARIYQGRSEACQHFVQRLDGVEFRMLHPSNRQFAGNNNSCVLQIDNGRERILLSGDIERQAELHLLEQTKDLQAGILIAPHHGSATSSSYAFLKAVKPDYAVFSAGFMNRFGHPATSISERYRILGVESFNTATSGAISVHLKPEGEVEIREHRADSPRFWYFRGKNKAA